MPTATQSLISSKNTDPLAYTIIRYPVLLWLMHLGWVMFMGAALLLSVLGLSALFNQLSEGGAPLSTAAFICPIQNDLLAVYVSFTSIIAVLAGATTATILYARASNSWLIWSVPIATIIFSLSGTNSHLVVSINNPTLQCLNFMK